MVVSDSGRKLPKEPRRIARVFINITCSQVGDSAVSVLKQAEVVNNSGQKLPKITPKDCEGVHQHYSVHKLEIARVQSNS